MAWRARHRERLAALVDYEAERSAAATDRAVGGVTEAVPTAEHEEEVVEVPVEVGLTDEVLRAHGFKRHGSHIYQVRGWRPPPRVSSDRARHVLQGEARVSLSLAGRGVRVVGADLAEGSPDLQVLDLSSNKIAMLPPSLAKLASLTTLLFQENQVGSLDPDLFARLSSLRVLNASNNRIAGPVEHEVLAGLRFLEELDLGWNEITALPASLASCTALRVLRLGHNRIRRLPDLRPLGLHLEVLSIAALPLGGRSVLQFFRHFPFLRELYMQSVGLEAIPLKLLEPSVKRLVVLNLRGNRLEEIPGQLVQGLLSLQTLDLGDNFLKTLPSEIGDLTRLRRLLLGGNRLEHLPPSFSSLRTRLRHLDLRNNPGLGRYLGLLRAWVDVDRLELDRPTTRA